MKRFFLLLSLFAFALPLSAHEDSAPQKVDIRNAKITSEGILTGGQPTQDQIAALKAAGYGTIINLRPDAEVKRAYAKTKNSDLHYDEASVAAKAGMSYKSIPIASGADLSIDNAITLDNILKNAKDGVVIHCVSGNRAGALLALRAYHVQKKSADEAMAIGRAGGMTSLSSTVRDLLKQPQ